MKPGGTWRLVQSPRRITGGEALLPASARWCPLANPLVRHVIQSMPLLFVGTRSAEDSLQSKAAGVTAYPLMAAKFRKIVVA